jgi:hypothetical protein
VTFVRRAAIEQAGNILMLKAGQNLALCRSQLFSGSRPAQRFQSSMSAQIAHILQRFALRIVRFF